MKNCLMIFQNQIFKKSKIQIFKFLNFYEKRKNKNMIIFFFKKNLLIRC